jgi:hypothetical protein
MPLLAVGMRSTRKRKLGLKDFTRCNPGVTRKSKNKCLPSSAYSSIKKRLQIHDDSKIFAALGCQPGEEHCLLDRAPIEEVLKKALRKQYLRPRRPKAWDDDPDMWLDNFNIMGVMKQYQEAYKWFKFLGVFPIDFSAPDPYTRGGPAKCLYKETCDLNLKHEYSNGIRGIGMIFNLDPHFKGGSHWVALYINLTNIKKPFVGYFDSYGYKTPPLIARLMRSFKLQISTCDLGFNARRFQYGDSECGMFSMYFIVCMMCGVSFKDFCKDAVNDKFMLELRKIFFAK